MWRRTALIVVGLGCLLALSCVGGAISPPVAAQQSDGTIAYVRGGDEIRLVQPDGSNDRSIWVGPNPNIPYQITGLDWRPDARALAFSSNHEEACSIFADDLFSILADGSGFRRVTNSPACANLASYPKGRVTVSVQNLTDLGPFYVYVQGAPSIVLAMIPPGGTTTVTFEDVADFGATLQQAVVINGYDRWIAPFTAADVQPGQTIHAGTLTVSDGGVRFFGAYAPAWHPDGSRLGYIFGDCAGLWGIAAAPPAGVSGDPLLNATKVFACVLDWGPTSALANQILYWSYLDGGIYQVTEGSADAGTQLVATESTENVIDVEWLPDGSGFLFTKTGELFASANIYHYDFASATVTPITQFADAFARQLTLSPDGQFIVFDLAAARDSLASDVMIMGRDGSNLRLLVANGRLPVWSQRAPQPPDSIYLPYVSR